VPDIYLPGAQPSAPSSATKAYSTERMSSRDDCYAPLARLRGIRSRLYYGAGGRRDRSRSDMLSVFHPGEPTL
jgi:hypothetical protein